MSWFSFNPECDTAVGWQEKHEFWQHTDVFGGYGQGNDLAQVKFTDHSLKLISWSPCQYPS